jgi:hypothetical protein
MAAREREILEHAVHTVAEQAAKADDLANEAIEIGHGRRIRSLPRSDTNQGISTALLRLRGDARMSEGSHVVLFTRTCSHM